MDTKQDKLQKTFKISSLIKHCILSFEVLLNELLTVARALFVQTGRAFFINTNKMP